MIELDFFQHRLARCNRLGDALLGAIDFGAACLALFGRQRAEPFSASSDQAALAEPMRTLSIASSASSVLDIARGDLLQRMVRFLRLAIHRKSFGTESEDDAWAMRLPSSRESRDPVRRWPLTRRAGLIQLRCCKALPAWPKASLSLARRRAGMTSRRVSPLLRLSCRTIETKKRGRGMASSPR